MSQLHELRDRIEYLEAEVGGLQELITGEKRWMKSIHVCNTISCTPMSARLLSILVQGTAVSKEAQLQALYSFKLDVPEVKIIDVWISKLRRNLKPFDITIETKWGQGYYLTAEMRRRVLDLIGEGEK